MDTMRILKSKKIITEYITKYGRKERLQNRREVCKTHTSQRFLFFAARTFVKSFFSDCGGVIGCFLTGEKVGNLSKTDDKIMSTDNG